MLLLLHMNHCLHHCRAAANKRLFNTLCKQITGSGKGASTAAFVCLLLNQELHD
jgi:hypothetical protein